MTSSPPKPTARPRIAEHLAEAIFKATHNIVWAQLSHILRPSIHLLVSMSNESASDPEESLEPGASSLGRCVELP